LIRDQYTTLATLSNHHQQQKQQRIPLASQLSRYGALWKTQRMPGGSATEKHSQYKFGDQEACMYIQPATRKDCASHGSIASTAQSD
jgi:hypothetical protein